MELADYLRAELRARGWTQTRLAREADVSKQAVGQWLAEDEHERLTPTPTSCEKIARALGVDTDYVLDLAGHRRAPSAPPSLNPDELRWLAMYRQLEEHQRPTAVRVVEALAGSARRQADGSRPAAGSDGTGHLVRPKIPWRGPADALTAWLLGALRPRPLVGLP